MSVVVRILAHALFRHWKPAGLVFGGCVTVAAIAAVALPAAWRAEATLVVKVGDQAELSGQALNAQLELLASQDVHERVAEAVGPLTLYPGLGVSGPGAVEAAAAAFGRDLSLRTRPGGLVDLSYDGASPQAAAQAVNALVEIYRERQGQLLSRNMAESPAEQVFTGQLQAAQDRLAAYKREAKVYDLDEQRALLLRHRSQLNSELRAATNEAEALGAKLRTLKVQLDSTPKTVALSLEPERGGPLEEARAKLLELQIKEQELLAKYREESQFVHTVRAEMRQVKEFLARSENVPASARMRSGVNEVYLQIEKETNSTQAQLNAAKSRVDSLTVQLTETDGEIGALAARERRLGELERDVKAAEENAAAIQRQTQDSRAANTLNQAVSVGIISNASVPREPVRPKPFLYMALGLLAGVVGAVALAFGLEAASRRFSTAAAVERRLRLPVLATLDYRG